MAAKTIVRCGAIMAFVVVAFIAFAPPAIGSSAGPASGACAPARGCGDGSGSNRSTAAGNTPVTGSCLRQSQCGGGAASGSAAVVVLAILGFSVSIAMTRPAGWRLRWPSLPSSGLTVADRLFRPPRFSS
jgi:hypothetical protein